MSDQPDAHVVTYVVEEAHAGARIDVFLVAVLPWRSRRELAEFVREGRVRLGGTVPKKSRRVSCGDVVTIALPIDQDHERELEAIELSILHEDEDLVIVDKPSGLAVHPASGCHHVNLLRRLELRYRQEVVDPSAQPSIVHRLDRNTSGVIVYARRRELVAFYTGQFEARTTSKIYAARVHGTPPHQGEFTWPLRVDDATNVVVDEHGKASQTTFAVLESAQRTSLLEVRPHTGRKHQIRVHLAHAGHPIVFDDLYGCDGQPSQWPVGSRLGLHAHVLELDHRNGKRLRVEASIPEALRCD